MTSPVELSSLQANKFLLSDPMTAWLVLSLFSWQLRNITAMKILLYDAFVYLLLTTFIIIFFFLDGKLEFHNQK